MRSRHSLNHCIDWGVLGLDGGFWGMQNVHTCESQSKNRCPLIFCDFCTIREEERGTRAIWCFERLQMALIRTYKICLALSLHQQAREGNWQGKRSRREKANDIKNHSSEALSYQNFITLLFFLFLLFPPLPPTLPSLMLVVCRQAALVFPLCLAAVLSTFTPSILPPPST